MNALICSGSICSVRPSGFRSVARAWIHNLSVGMCGALLSTLTALTGCASTQTVQQSLSLADTGTAYAAVASQVLDDARTAYLDWDSQAMVDELPGSPAEADCKPTELVPGADVAPACQEAQDAYDKSTTDVRRTVRSFSILQAHAQALGAYFTALKTLADYGGGAAAEAATQRLAEQINGLTSALESDSKVAVSEQQVTAYKKLADLAMTAAKGQALQSALKRDAATIARAIDIQERAIASHIAILKGIGDASNVGREISEVRTPYLTGTVKSTDQWRAARTATLLHETLIARLEAVQSSSSRLRLIWDDILNGRTSAENARLLFDDLSHALSVFADVRKAGAPAK